jgi:hypothetical protein
MKEVFSMCSVDSNNDVPEAERKEIARSVAAWVLESLDNASALKGPEGGDPKGSCRSCCG